MDVVLGNQDVVQPDVLHVAADRLNIITRANVVAAPDLIVEVLSPSTARWDRQTKRGVYAKYRVWEYWLVDTEARTVEVAALVTETPETAQLETAGVHAAGARVKSRLLPELVIQVAELFEDDFGSGGGSGRS